MALADSWGNGDGEETGLLSTKKSVRPLRGRFGPLQDSRIGFYTLKTPRMASIPVENGAVLASETSLVSQKIAAD